MRRWLVEGECGLASGIELYRRLVQLHACESGRFRTLPGLVRREQKRFIRKLDLGLAQGGVAVEGLEAVMRVLRGVAE